MTGGGTALKRLVPKISRERIREIFENRVVGAVLVAVYIDDVVMKINIIIELLPTIYLQPIMP